MGLNEGNAAEGFKESHVKPDESLVPLNYLSFSFFPFLPSQSNQGWEGGLEGSRGRGLLCGAPEPAEDTACHLHGIDLFINLDGARSRKPI